MPTNRHIIAGLIVFISIGIGMQIALTSWDGLVFVSTTKFTKGRGPAAINKVFDFSHLDGGALKAASQKRLVTDARIVREEGLLGIELGHFVMRGQDGQRQLACEFYDRVQLIFHAEGVAESGNRPSMMIEAPCQFDATDVNRMSPIRVPIDKITGRAPASGEVKIPFFENEVFTFEHVISEWPRVWALSNVRLYHSNDNGREVRIEEKDLREIQGRPLMLFF